MDQKKFHFPDSGSGCLVMSWGRFGKKLVRGCNGT